MLKEKASAEGASEKNGDFWLFLCNFRPKNAPFFLAADFLGVRPPPRIGSQRGARTKSVKSRPPLDSNLGGFCPPLEFWLPVFEVLAPP